MIENKKCQLIMAQTNDPSFPCLTMRPSGELFWNTMGLVKGIGFKYYHLYVVSNEEITSKDWFLFFSDYELPTLHQFHSDAGYGIKTYTQYNQETGSSLLVSSSKCSNKIIATTNPELNKGIIYDGEYFDSEFKKGLPRPNDEFFKHLNGYLQSTKGSEVLVEYEMIPFSIAAPDRERISRVKIYPDNTIKITLIELDDYAELSKMGLTSDQCSEVCDYIDANYKKK